MNLEFNKAHIIAELELSLRKIFIKFIEIINLNETIFFIPGKKYQKNILGMVGISRNLWELRELGHLNIKKNNNKIKSII